MRSSSSSGQRGFPFHKKEQASKYSVVLYVTWLLIALWIGFLLYCYHYGLIDKKKIDTVIESVKNTEQSLLRGHRDGVPISSSAEGESVLLSPFPGTGVVPVVSETHNKESAGAASWEHDEDAVHVIFSTDCTPYQDWQTLVLFYSARIVKQRGTVTRIASGCTDEKRKELETLYETLYPDLPFRAHFTPDFKRDEKTNRKYDFYNKPWGLKHWLEHTSNPLPDTAIVALLDPDMILLRPITPAVANAPHIVSRRIPKDEIFDRVSLSHPAAQTYGLGAPWTNDNHKHFNRGKICGEGSPCLIPDMRFGELHYAVGPPYVVAKGDFVRIAQSWTTLVPRVYEGYPYLLAEMYAYSMASAHESLPHLQLDHYMVSNVDAGGEGWEWVDELDSVCLPPDETTGLFYPQSNLPTVVHFCQTYRAGDLMYTKRQVPKDIFSCDAPLFVEPPKDLAQTNFFYKKKEKKPVKDKIFAKRNAFMLCTIYSVVNDALVDYKKRMCTHGERVNLDKTLHL